MMEFVAWAAAITAFFVFMFYFIKFGIWVITSVFKLRAKAVAHFISEVETEYEKINDNKSGDATEKK